MLSRWYDGGGLYRHVRLAVVPALHLARPGGVYVPSTVEGAIDAARMRADAKVAPTITVVASAGVSSSFTLTTVVRDATGVEVGRSEAQGVAVPSQPNVTVETPPIALSGAALWTLESPPLTSKDSQRNGKFRMHL